MDEVGAGPLATKPAPDISIPIEGVIPWWVFSFGDGKGFRCVPDSRTRAGMVRWGMNKFSGKQGQTGRRIPVKMFSEHHWPLALKVHLTETHHEKVRLFRLGVLAMEAYPKLAA